METVHIIKTGDLEAMMLRIAELAATKAVTQALIGAQKQEASAVRYLTRVEVCKMLRISEVTLYHRMKAKEIPHSRCGRRVLFSQNEISVYLSKKESEVSHES